MKIQQHDNVVVEVAGISAGLRQAQREGEVLWGEREAPGAWVRSPPSPLYIGALGGAGPKRSHLKGGRRPRGDLPPKSGGAPPPPGFPTLGAGGGPRGAHQTTRGWFPSHFSPWGPPG